MIQSHTEGKILNSLENFVCNKTNIFANAKILEESNPCELIALKCKMDYFLNVQYSIISLKMYLFSGPVGKHCYLGKEEAFWLKREKLYLQLLFL